MKVLTLQNTYYLDSIIIYKSNVDKFGSSGHYMCMKLLNRQWFLFNDAEVYSVDLPKYPLNIYMAFFRKTCTMGFASIRGWDQKHVWSLPLPQLKALIGLDSNPIEPKVKAKKGKVQARNTRVKVNEGKFVEPSQNTAFTSKMGNRPKLLTKKPPARKRKSPSDEDDDYDPNDDVIDTEDTLEDIELEQETIEEPLHKRNLKHLC